MKPNIFLFLCILIMIIQHSHQSSYLTLTYQETDRYDLNTGTWKDLLGVKVECPNGGIIKNFTLRKDSSYLWYEFWCYSSESPYSDEGEPIIKGLTLRSTYKYTVNIQENIRTLSGYPVECWVDYGLMSFQLYNDNGILRREAVCHGLKSKFSTKVEIQTATGTARATTIDGLIGITVGSQATEDDDNIAYPLRGFQYKIDTSSSNERPTVSYLYAYSILRNMKIVKQKAQATFENLRNSNTQKD